MFLMMKISTLLLAIIMACLPPQLLTSEWHDKEARIMGGEDVQPNEYPWMVYMQLVYLPLHEWQKPMNDSCDGTIINRRWIISAGHCFAPNGFNLTKINIFLGTHNVSDVTEIHRKVLTGKKAIVHEKYDHWNIKNDIALIELNELIQFDQYISPIELPVINEVNNYTNCITLGWGRTGQFQPPSKTLKKVQQIVQPLSECRKHYEDVDQTQICAGQLNQGPCPGDSGGPLQCLIDEKWTLEGIVSYGSPNYTVNPAVYTKVSSFIDWINKTMANQLK